MSRGQACASVIKRHIGEGVCVKNWPKKSHALFEWDLRGEKAKLK